MAVRFSSRCFRSLPSYSSAARSYPHFFNRGELLSLGICALSRDRQQPRWFAKDATGDAGPKTATPNAAKAAKAKKTVKKEEKKEQRARFNDLIDACLNAPPPIRALKEKERLRLLEREKLGVVSHERLREIEQEKAREKAAKASAKKKAKEDAKEARAKPGAEEDRHDEDLIVPAETPGEPPSILTADEGKRLAKECSRVLLNETRQRANGESVRLQLKKAAIAALPQHLRDAALVPDLTPFPKNRIPASLTPPIPGYVEDRAKSAATSVTLKKSR